MVDYQGLVMSGIIIGQKQSNCNYSPKIIIGLGIKEGKVIAREWKFNGLLFGLCVEILQNLNLGQ